MGMWSRRSLRGSALTMAISLLSGCAQYEWQKHGARASRDDFNRESYQCEMETASAHPAVMVDECLRSRGYQRIFVR